MVHRPLRIGSCGSPFTHLGPHRTNHGPAQRPSGFEAEYSPAQLSRAGFLCWRLAWRCAGELGEERRRQEGEREGKHAHGAPAVDDHRFADENCAVPSLDAIAEPLSRAWPLNPCHAAVPEFRQ
jgi:hypothetical protein